MQIAIGVGGVFVLFAAPFIGSFLGLVALRLPQNEGVVWGRSHCRACNTPLGVLDLIPLFSWLANKGLCRHCHAPVSAYYPIMEITALGIALMAWGMLDGWWIWIGSLFGWVLLGLAACDIRHMVLPNELTLPLIPIGLIMIWQSAPNLLVDHLIGAALGYSLFYLISYSYEKFRGRIGLGLGDAKLMAVAGAWVSWAELPHVILGASLMALTWVIIARTPFKNIDWHRPIPFGPFLCIAIWGIWFWGNSGS